MTINESNMLQNAFHYIIDFVAGIWNYTIIVTADKQNIDVSNIVIGLILFILGLRLAKYLSYIVRSKFLTAIRMDESVANSLEKISYYIFLVLTSLFVLEVSKVPLTIFAFIGTALAIGVGLGSQNITNNFISGLLIMVERPIKLGDIVEIDSVVGKVTNIGARCISLRTNSNINMLVPNSYILQNNVINWTLHDSVIKAVTCINIEHNSSIDKVEEILYFALTTNTNILKTPLPQVYFSEYSKDGLRYEMEFWFNLASDVERKKIISDLHKTIFPLFKEHDIKIATPIARYIPHHLEEKNEDLG